MIVHRVQHRTLLTVFGLILQTSIIVQMLSNGGEGTKQLKLSLRYSLKRFTKMRRGYRIFVNRFKLYG